MSVYFIKFSHIPGFSLSMHHLGFIIFYFLLEGRLSSRVRVKSSNPRVTRVSGLVDDSPDITKALTTLTVFYVGMFELTEMQHFLLHMCSQLKVRITLSKNSDTMS